ncbi:hypothetical protein J6590_080213 [Homalodisca vitripennis]|nr:hypothetical protein J6590_080213 [Homalodisca vitripennis]
MNVKSPSPNHEPNYLTEMTGYTRRAKFWVGATSHPVFLKEQEASYLPASTAEMGNGGTPLCVNLLPLQLGSPINSNSNFSQNATLLKTNNSIARINNSQVGCGSKRLKLPRGNTLVHSCAPARASDVWAATDATEVVSNGITTLLNAFRVMYGQQLMLLKVMYGQPTDATEVVSNGITTLLHTFRVMYGQPTDATEVVSNGIATLLNTFRVMYGQPTDATEVVSNGITTLLNTFRVMYGQPTDATEVVSNGITTLLNTFRVMYGQPTDATEVVSNGITTLLNTFRVMYGQPTDATEVVSNGIATLLNTFRVMYGQPTDATEVVSNSITTLLNAFRVTYGQATDNTYVVFDGLDITGSTPHFDALLYINHTAVSSTTDFVKQEEEDRYNMRLTSEMIKSEMVTDRILNYIITKPDPQSEARAASWPSKEQSLTLTYSYLGAESNTSLHTFTVTQRSVMSGTSAQLSPLNP